MVGIDATLWWPSTEVANSPFLTLERCQPWERGGGRRDQYAQWWLLRGTELAARPRRAHTLLGQEQTRTLFFQTLLSTAGLVGRGRTPSSCW